MSLQFPCFTFWFVFTRNLTVLGLNVEWITMLKTQAIFVPFFGIYCCLSPIDIKSVAVRFVNERFNSYCTYRASIIECTKRAGTALKGGCSLLKASVAICESLYYCLTDILCIIPPCVCSRCSKRFQTNHHLLSGSLRNSITGYRISISNRVLTRRPAHSLYSRINQ